MTSLIRYVIIPIMKSIKLVSTAATLSMGLFMLSTSVASADTIYGGYGYGYGYNAPAGEKTISIDKKVKNPQTGSMVDQLSLTDPKFVADQAIVFQLTIKNTGKVALNNIVVEDSVPQYLTITDKTVSDRRLDFSENDKRYYFTIDALNAGESKTYTLNGKIASSAQLPVNAGSFCLVNKADTRVDGLYKEDNAQFCVTVPSQTTTKGGLPVYPAPVVKTTPSTGPEALALFALAPLAGIGQFLRKKSA